jgi:AcrR family transcriptional regulator
VTARSPRAARAARAPRAARVRRSAEAAHEQILDAADKRLAEHGPRGIRLQDIAQDVGVSHPTILHHFGSREGLVEAVVDRALASLQSRVIASFAAGNLEAGEGAALVRQIMTTLGDRGHARLMAWLALEGRAPEDPAKLLSTLAAVMHGRRVVTTASQAPAEDTLFMVMLVSLALFGEGVLGASVLDSAGLARDADARERFHAWIVRLVEAHLHGPGLVAEPTVPTRAAARRSGPRRKP